ncbi:MAG: arsenate reductase family protein [Spirochaetia bacterium]
MTVQLFGTKKSQATKKVERFLKERGIAFQFVDINRKAPSGKELDSLAQAAGGHEALIDTSSKRYLKRGMQYMTFDAREELLDDPTLMRVPAVRCDAGVAIEPDEARLRGLLGESRP